VFVGMGDDVAVARLARQGARGSRRTSGVAGTLEIIAEGHGGIHRDRTGTVSNSRIESKGDVATGQVLNIPTEADPSP
jgi:hypothetical protein